MARQLTAFASAVAITLLINANARNAAAQSLTTEADVTAGASTENVAAAATQLRAFGDVGGGWHFYGDASWAATRGNASDGFGAAYPYDSKPRLMELKIEKTLASERRVFGVRMGRYRTPFGIYSGSDQGYMGFLRAPLIRNSYYWALSNNYLENGASVVAGTPSISLEASAGVATDQDEFSRRGGLNEVIRVQGAHGAWIAGISYIRTRPATSRPFAKGFTEISGTDLRWMKGGVQLRGGCGRRPAV